MVVAQFNTSWNLRNKLIEKINSTHNNKDHGCNCTRCGSKLEFNTNDIDFDYSWIKSEDKDEFSRIEGFIYIICPVCKYQVKLVEDSQNIKHKELELKDIDERH